MQRPLTWAAVIAASALALCACGDEAPPTEPQPKGASATALPQETAGAVALIPTTKTDAPIRLRIDREDNLAIHGFTSARTFESDPGWIYWGHFDRNRKPRARLHVLTAVLRAEAARRPRGSDGLSEATLELQAEKDVRCSPAFRILLLAAADDQVRITRFWFRSDDEDDGARLELVAQAAGPGGGRRPPTVTADARSAGRGKPDLVFLLPDRDNRLSNAQKSTVEDTRESLALAWARWKSRHGAAQTSARRFSVYARGGEPPLAWTIVRLLQAADELGFASLQWEASPLGD